MHSISQALQGKGVLGGRGSFEKEAKMKNDTSVERPETRTVALLAGLSIGLGFVAHEVFFLVAAAILLIRPAKRVWRYVYGLEQRPRRYRPA
jgi:hypothetical protein